MARIVVMGTGIGGISQVYELRKMLGREHEHMLVGDSDRFEFTPSNPWVAVGWREENDIIVDLPELIDEVRHRIFFGWRPPAEAGSQSSLTALRRRS